MLYILAYFIALAIYRKLPAAFDLKALDLYRSAKQFLVQQECLATQLAMLPSVISLEMAEKTEASSVE